MHFIINWLLFIDFNLSIKKDVLDSFSRIHSKLTLHLSFFAQVGRKFYADKDFD